MSGHAIDKLTIAAYSTDDLSQKERATFETHLQECSECRDYYELLTREKNDFLAKYPYEPFAIPKTKKIIPFPMSNRIYALAASLLFLLTGTWIYYSSQQPDTMRIKGGNDIRVVVQGLDGTIEERSSHTYHPGERIQCIYSCTDRNNFMLFSLDETGALSTYLPAAGDSSITLQKGADIPLPNSILLDDYIGKELFIAIFSERPLYVPGVKQYIKKQYTNTGSLDSVRLQNTRDCTVHSLLISKHEREQ